ncbi:MAG TPA: pyruvate, phosphate dikinase, partial [Armatimonadetes bacterium]|nr:pyruvate, phosphate dikinase [Armatimonadota bacterium]
LREAKGAPADAGLGLVVQKMALGVGLGLCGSGVIQFVNASSGESELHGRYLCQSQGRDALTHAGERDVLYLTKDERGRSIEEVLPQNFADLIRFGELCRTRLREEMQIEFTIENEALFVLDAIKVARSARANVKIAVGLARDKIISKSDAICRIEPRALSEMLHIQVDPQHKRDRLVSGIPASPGAASGQLVFTSRDAQSCAARDELCILVRRETSSEEIRGIHAADGVLTQRGGITSHAAVIARGLGLPCVVAASDMVIDAREGCLTFKDGRQFRKGEMITLDGTMGEALAGEAKILPPELRDDFRTLLTWADEVRDIGVRANADTPEDARKAMLFSAEGIGLCRTEHMFIDDDRLLALREMIFADHTEDRRAALERLLPMQRADFSDLFRITQGKPVCIRLLDPPLHE